MILQLKDRCFPDTPLSSFHLEARTAVAMTVRRNDKSEERLVGEELFTISGPMGRDDY